MSIWHNICYKLTTQLLHKYYITIISKPNRVFQTKPKTNQNFKKSIPHIPIKQVNSNNNNNNNHDNVYGAVIMAEPLREFTQFIWWM